MHRETLGDTRSRLYTIERTLVSIAWYHFQRQWGRISGWMQHCFDLKLVSFGANANFGFTSICAIFQKFDTRMMTFKSVGSEYQKYIGTKTVRCKTLPSSISPMLWFRFVSTFSVNSFLTPSITAMVNCLTGVQMFVSKILNRWNF
jgi:hypothetical protein